MEKTNKSTQDFETLCAFLIFSKKSENVPFLCEKNSAKSENVPFFASKGCWSKSWHVSIIKNYSEFTLPMNRIIPVL